MYKFSMQVFCRITYTLLGDECKDCLCHIWLYSLLHDEVLAMASKGCSTLNNSVKLVNNLSLQN